MIKALQRDVINNQSGLSNSRGKSISGKCFGISFQITLKERRNALLSGYTEDHHPKVDSNEGREDSGS